MPIKLLYHATQRPLSAHAFHKRSQRLISPPANKTQTKRKSSQDQLRFPSIRERSWKCNYNHGNILLNGCPVGKRENCNKTEGQKVDHVIMGKFVGGMCLYIPINRHRGERDSQSFAINSWSFAIRAATVPNRREVLSRVKGRNLFRHLILP